MSAHASKAEKPAKPAKNAKDQTDTEMSQQDYLARVATFHLPRYEQIPDIGLYMDQLLKYISDQVGFLASVYDKPLTAAMVNNYVKQRLVPQPKKKRYERVHVAYLIAVCVMKRTFSIADIDRLIELEMHHRYQVPGTYDFFCAAFEESMRVLFCGAAEVNEVGGFRLATGEGGFALTLESGQQLDADHKVAIAAATSAAAKVFVDKQLDWLQGARDAEAILEACEAPSEQVK